MGFKLDSYDADQLLLKRESFGCTNMILLPIGLALLGVGLNSFTDTYGDGIHFLFLSFAITLFGAMFTLAGGVLLPSQHRKIPKQILFDHKKGVMEVRMDLYKQAGYIPYRDIEDFGIEKIGDVDSEYKNVYHVFFRKKDGAQWNLLSTVSPRSAEKNLSLLREQVPLNRETTIFINRELPARITSVETSGRSMIHWRNKFSPVFLFLFLFATFFSTATGMAIYDLSVKVLAIPFVLASAGMFFLVYKLIQLYTRRFALAVAGEHLQYYEFSAWGGKQRKQKSISLTDIDRVVYSYSPQDNGTCQFKIITHHLESKPLTFQIEGMNPPEALAIENWLQQKIGEKRTGGTVG